MNILLSGASGLLGSALAPLLRERGHTVTRLVRSRPVGEDEAFWNPLGGELDDAIVARCDAVIHLSGESVAARWTSEKRAAILDSRVLSTRLLAQSIARNGGQQVLVHASGVGFYGDQGDRILDEHARSGEGFLAHVCREWEAAAEPARQAGARVVSARIGVVLSPEGGALKSLLPLFRLGLGGPVGSGRQWWSWISISDLTRALAFLVEESTVSGAVNVAAPNALRNKDFARVLGRVLRRPAILPAPPLALRAMLGQAADEMLLYSQRARPQVLVARGFGFEHPNLEGAFGSLLS